MLTDLLKASWKTIIFIALISLTITWAFQIPNTMIQTQTINNIEIKTFNLSIYLQNISNSWNTNALDFRTIIPTREFTEVTGTFVEQTFWNTLFNNIVCAFDWLYFPINFILYIIRWLAWLITILLALIGWNTMKDANGNYYSQLVMILKWITSKLVIPYL